MGYPNFMPRGEDSLNVQHRDLMLLKSTIYNNCFVCMLFWSSTFSPIYCLNRLSVAA